MLSPNPHNNQALVLILFFDTFHTVAVIFNMEGLKSEWNHDFLTQVLFQAKL